LQSAPVHALPEIARANGARRQKSKRDIRRDNLAVLTVVDEFLGPLVVVGRLTVTQRRIAVALDAVCNRAIKQLPPMLDRSSQFILGHRGPARYRCHSRRGAVPALDDSLHHLVDRRDLLLLGGLFFGPYQADVLVSIRRRSLP